MSVSFTQRLIAAVSALTLTVAVLATTIVPAMPNLSAGTIV